MNAHRRGTANMGGKSPSLLSFFTMGKPSSPPTKTQKVERNPADENTEPSLNKRSSRYKRRAQGNTTKKRPKKTRSKSKKTKGDKRLHGAYLNQDAEPMSNYLCLSQVCFVPDPPKKTSGATSTGRACRTISHEQEKKEQEKEEQEKEEQEKEEQEKEEQETRVVTVQVENKEDEAVICSCDSDVTVVATGNARPGLWTVIYPTEKRPSPTCEARERMKSWSFDVMSLADEDQNSQSAPEDSDPFVIGDDDVREENEVDIGGEECEEEEEKEELLRVPTMRDEVGDYIGERNRMGQPHGHGVCISSGRFISSIRLEGTMPTTRLVYEGHWVDGKRNGRGVCTWDEADAPLGLDAPVMVRYDGEWRNDEMHGRGRCLWSDGSRYIGQFSHNEMEGHGYVVWDEGMEEGEDENQVEEDMNQEGKTEAKDQLAVPRRKKRANQGDEGTVRWYDGTFHRGKMHGRGVLSSGMEGSRYEGQFAEGKKHGYGTFSIENGGIFVGQFRNNLKCGRGTYTWPEGSRYLGQWKNDRPCGDGVWYGPGGERYEVNIEKAASVAGVWKQQANGPSQVMALLMSHE